MMALAASSSSSSSSSSSCSSTFEAKHHDVFLSFRGEDTRDNFTSHLYAALCSKKIGTFIDNNLHRGDEISPSLLKAIKESKIATIVFSKGYATSRWCLEELAEIIECKKFGDLVVIPVFYNVDPSYVRNQTGTFGEAFVNHEEKFEESLEKVQRWRIALTEAANISGFDSKNRSEASLIEAIVKDILKRLNDMSPSYNEDLVGIQPSIKKIVSLLNLELDDIIMVGIWGMGGIGKTTLADVVFNRILNQFESVYFQNDVREQSEKFGSIHLCQALLSTILEDQHAIFQSNFTKNRLRKKKILLVFDDVTCSKQVKEFIRDPKYFGPGSRIIITSRDKQVLKICGVNRDKIHEVKPLMHDDALTLFSRHAFKSNHPTMDYKMKSIRVLEFTGGVPLALKVLGDFLFERTRTEWKSALDGLERNPNPDIQNVLKISYEGLDHQAKDIFLDIACFFSKNTRDFVREILDVPEIKISILIDKSLVTVVNNRITMHDLLRKMGWEIVEQESKDIGKRSRLWQPDHIRHVLRTNTGSEAIEGMCLDLSKLREDMILKRKAFLNMCKLKFLDIYYIQIYGFYCECFKARPSKMTCLYCLFHKKNTKKVRAPKGLKFASTELRLFRWFGYPLESLPSNFDLENLIALILPGSNIKQLWKGLKSANKLKHINLIHSKHLESIPDLSLTPNLESLILQGCTSLIEVPSSIPCLNELVILNLQGCKSLSSLPTSIQSESLTDVILSGCSNLKTAPQITRNMKRLFLDGTAIEELSVKEYSSRLVEFNLVGLDLTGCSRFEDLPESICMFKYLKFLLLSGCSRLNRLPNDLRNLEALEEFVVENTAIREVPSSFVHLNKLHKLSLAGLKDLVVPALTASLHLRYLNLSDRQLTKLPDSLFQLASLESLNLRGNNFGCIPASIKNLSKLGYLDVSRCERLQSLPKLPEIRSLVANNCTSLKEIDSSFFQRSLSDRPLMDISLGNCCKLDLKMLKAKVDKVLRQHQVRAYKFIYPGNEIPEGFSIQNKAGSSVAFELPLDIMKKILLSFYWCVVLTFQAGYDSHVPFSDSVYFMGHKLIARDKDGKWEKQLNPQGYVHSFSLPNDGHGVTTDHVLMSSSLVSLSEMLKDLGNFDLNVHVTIEFYFKEVTEVCEIKKCGIKLLYEQDCWSSDEETEEYEEERKEPNPKRLKI